MEEERSHKTQNKNEIHDKQMKMILVTRLYAWWLNKALLVNDGISKLNDDLYALVEIGELFIQIVSAIPTLILMFC